MFPMIGLDFNKYLFYAVSNYDSKNFIRNIPVNTKKVIIISVILIIAVSYGLFFYMQDNIENSMRNQLFDKQKALQTGQYKLLARGHRHYQFLFLSTISKPQHHCLHRISNNR
jgi:hypothetical protein